MSVVFVVGLLKPLKQKFDAECTRNGFFNKSILTDFGRKDTRTLLPIENEATHSFNAYLESLDSLTEAHVIVLPYAPIPKDLRAELDTLSDLGGTIIWGNNGQDDWPEIDIKEAPDTSKLNNLFKRLWQAMPIEDKPEDSPPSEHFRQIAEENAQILFAEDVFSTCDLVAPHRWRFMESAIDALVEFQTMGSDGRIDAFFKEKGLDHAQTGGINSSIEVFHNDKNIVEETSNKHLKKGDKTTPEGSPRIYYHIFECKKLTYVAVTYAGPHPEKDTHRIFKITTTT